MVFSSVLLPFVLFFITVFLVFIHYFFNQRPPPSSTSAPILKSYAIVGTLPHVLKNSNRMLDWSTELLTSSPTLTVTVFPFVFTSDPSNVEYITKSNFGNYPKSDFFKTSFHDFIGDGIVNVDGEPWKHQRKLASYEFSTGSLRAFVLERVQYQIEEGLIPLMASASKLGHVLDMQDVLDRFAFDSICNIAFGYNPDCLSKKNEEGDRFFHAFDEASHLSVERVKLPFSAIWKLKKLLDVGSEKRLRESLEIVNGIIHKFIQSKRVDNKSTENRDFLSHFEKDGTLQSNKSLRDMLISFLIAGRDTTPAALTWFFWILSSRPDIVDNITAEIRSIRTSNNPYESFTLDSLRKMNYLHAAISESLRLYPPVPLLAREFKSEDKLPDGTEVKKGCIVMYNSFMMGRSERTWGMHCQEFRPERWLVDGVFRSRSPFEYPVFHAGPRICLGKDMAFIQMKAVIASVLERFEMEVVEERGKHQLSISLKMEGGLPVRVKERNGGISKQN